MTRVNSKTRRVIAVFLLAVMLVTGFGSQVVTSEVSAAEVTTYSDSLIRSSLSEISSVLTSTAYSEYLSTYQNYGDATDEIVIDLSKLVADSTDASIVYADKLGGKDNVLVTSDDGGFTVELDVPESAFYSLELTYYTGVFYLYSCDECGHVVFSETKSSYDVSDACPACGATTAKGVMRETYTKDAAIERIALVDGVAPYKEARSISFQKSWADSFELDNGDVVLSTSDEFKATIANGDRMFPLDSNDNEMKPDKTQDARWVTTYVYDSTGYSNDPLKFFFSAGKHTFTIDAQREPMAISSMVFKTVADVPSYADYIAKHEANGAKNVSVEAATKIQAETPILTSNKTIYQLNDRASVLSEPQDVATTVLNEIGGDKWQYVGQWIEWEFTAPESGFYYIVPRSIQDYYSGVYVSRKVLIDGVQPFEEAGYCRFNNSDNWVVEPLNCGKDMNGDGEIDSGDSLKFYIEKGTHILRMEVVLGDMASILSEISESLVKVNAYYRKILMVTGPSPDEYRDYGFDRTMPDVIRGLKKEAELLTSISGRLEEIIGYKGDHSITLDKVAYVVNQMGYYPNKIASLMDDLKTQTGSLGTWLTSTQNQPLDLDYILFMSPDDKTPEAEAGFFATIWQELKKFVMSFFIDYTSISSRKGDTVVEADAEHSIEVWTFTSRDQAQIMRSLLDDDFSTRYPGINVNIKLVVAGTLLPATLAGTGPDVSMGSAQTEAINYAIRSAVKALNSTTNGYNFNDFSAYKDDPVYSQFIDDVDTFDEVKARFSEEAMVPLTIYGETFGIPENMSFFMLFYRKDILAELGLEVPVTWDDFYDMIYVMQSNSLQIGFPTGVTGSTIWMYQLDEPMYKEGNYDKYMEKYGDKLRAEGNTYFDENGVEIPKTDGMLINLDSDLSLAQFNEVCKFYTMYDFPVTYDFANRFRSGEMPIAVADYTAYNQLIVFAPEIKGLWEFTPLPAMVDEQGNYNNTTVGTVTTSMMMRSVDERNNEFAAWTFMQWWTSANIQSSYGNEMEALLGPSAKMNTANLEALYAMPWSKSEYDNLYAQFQSVTCTPMYPGSYIIARNTNFAFLSVYNESAEPVSKLQSYIDSINAELSRKREEFGLPTAEEYPLEFED